MKFSQDSKILVTGASGFVGSNLIQRLLEIGADVTSLVRKREGANQRSKIAIGDLTDKNLNISGDFDVVYHLASLTPLVNNKKLLEEVNYTGTKNLFEAVKEKTKSFVYISGLTVFDSKDVNINENTKINPDTYFTKLRVMAQQYLSENCKDKGIDFTVVHAGDIAYGNGGFFKKEIVNRLKKGTFRIPGSGNYFKNYIHIDDVIGGLVSIVEKNATNQSFILTGSNQATFKEFINFLSDLLGVKHPKTVPVFLAKLVIRGDLVDLMTNSMIASNEKIRKFYDFKYPTYQEGLTSIISELNKNT